MRSPRRSRRLWWGAVVAGVGVLGGVAAFSSSSTEPPGQPTRPMGAAREGGKAAAIELEDVREGAPAVSLAALSGTPVVLNFFASWCAPCAKELPAFQAVADDTKGRVAFVGVNHQDSRDAAQKLMAETGVRFPAGYDPEGDVARAYRLRGMPTTIFISAGGQVLERRNGEMSGTELRQAVDRLFERSSKTG